MLKHYGTNRKPSSTSNNELFLLEQAMHLTYKDNNSIFYHLNKFQACFDQFSGMDMKFGEEIFGVSLPMQLLKGGE